MECNVDSSTNTNSTEPQKNNLNTTNEKENELLDSENVKKYSGDISNVKNNNSNENEKKSQNDISGKKRILTESERRNNNTSYSLYLDSPVQEKKYSGLFGSKENSLLEKVLSEIFDKNDDDSLNFEPTIKKENKHNKKHSSLLESHEKHHMVERQSSNIFDEEENYFLKRMIFDFNENGDKSLNFSRESSKKEISNENEEKKKEKEATESVVDDDKNILDDYMNDNIEILHNEPSFIQKHLQFIEDKRVIQWMNENKNYKEKIMNEVVTGLNNGNIDHGSVDTCIKDENLKEVIKIAFITNEMDRLKAKLEIKKVLESKDINLIKGGIQRNIEEMNKIKNYKKCKLHSDLVNLYNELQEKYIINIVQEEKKLRDSFLRGIMVKLSELKSYPNYMELFNNNYKEVEDLSPENKMEIKETLVNIMSDEMKLEELLYNISNTNIRLEIEEKILMCNEDQVEKINQLEKQLDELESKFVNDNTLDSSNELKDKMTEFLRKCIEQIVVNNNNKYQSDSNSVLIKIYQKYHEKLEVFNILSSNIPRFKEKYVNILNRFGHMSDSINPTINQRYIDFKTIFHNEALNNKDSDYADVMVALIKMGANVSLKDNNGKTPFDYIDSNKIGEVYDNLNKSLSKTNVESAFGIRILRGILEIEITKKNNNENLEKYFNSIMAFVKKNKDLKSYEEMEDILGNHIWHEENTFIRKEREKYFTELKKKCKVIIDEIITYFKNNGLNDMGLTMDNKKWKSDDNEENIKYNDNLKKIDNAVDELQIINTYLLEKSSVKFIVEKNTIKNEIEIINYNTFSEAINRCMEDDIEKFLMEYPSQVDMTLNNDNDILEEIIDQKNVRLLESLKKNGRDLNSFMKDGKLPLEKAIENNNAYFVKEMINLGVSLDTETKSGIKLKDLIKEKIPSLSK
ncbi:hypothetical protein H8356DRAFT_1745758 [Neocallimastix lanati (nom. inval.)]|jgi:hypothetical protein|nr:hypothetical protein H8356DRAFT_1745758 [Neocallimastix sp. JGI-2020a]